MKRLTGITAIVSGVLLIAVPRYILPACEYKGLSRMHCSDTAQAELVVGALFILAGAIVLLMKKSWATLAGGCLSVALAVSAYTMPNTFGFCHSTKMPCNYGMVPAIRLISVVSGLVAATAVIMLALRARKKGK
jgi:hypothetical protein